MKFYDTHTLYVTSGVATEEQLYTSLKLAIHGAEINLDNENLLNKLYDNYKEFFLDEIEEGLSKEKENKLILEYLISEGISVPKKTKLGCKIKVNLIINKNGEYYGFGYMRVSNEKVYWMLLGKNIDGSERILEYKDPEWIPPLPKPEVTFEQELERQSKMDWYEIALEEDKYVHPIIKETLESLMKIPGYKYNKKQYEHLTQMAINEGKNKDDVPKIGYFEVSRAYGRKVINGKMRNVLCARQVPNWIPSVAFREIFKFFCSFNSSVYPIVKLIDGKKSNMPSKKIVFITFGPETDDAIFALLMTRKIIIQHPKNKNLKCTLIFDYAYNNSNVRNR